MFRKFIRKHLKITKKPLDLFYDNKPVKKFNRKYKLLNIIYREKRLITFLFGNHLAFLGEILLTWILTEAFYMHYIFSYGISLIIGWIFVFLFHHYITFEIKSDSYRRLPLFIVITAISNTLSWFLVYLLTQLLNQHFLHRHYIMTIIIVSIPMSLIYYILNKKFVFRLPF